MGISAHILSSWEKKSQKTLQGQNRTFSDVQIEFIKSRYIDYDKERMKVKITAFMKYLRQQWQEQSWLTPAPSRKTVEDMLLANGLRKPKSTGSHNQKPNYHPAVDRHFPHVQSVMDGKEVVVSINKNDYSFIMEFSKDMATDAICGSSVGKSENADLVKEAFNQHSQNYQKPLSTLIDNGKGNHKAAIDLGSEGTLFIKAWPYHPETKGQIEGEFGLFERNVSRIHIKGQSEQEKAMSILETLSRLYIRVRNSSPRCSVCPFTPEKLMKVRLDSTEAENAYQVLNEQQKIKKKEKEKRLKISNEKNDLIDSIVKELRLTGDRLRLKQSLKWIEIATLKEAEQIFSTYSRKDNFDSSKRNMAYFYAIARNLQREKDQKRKEQTARYRYSLDVNSREKREKIEAELARKKEKELLENEPHLKLINAIVSEMNLPSDFRKTISIFKNQMDEAIQSILRKKEQRRHTIIKNTHQAIMGLSQFSMDVRYEWINYVNERIDFLNVNGAKVVTPI